ncbi:hypothetical protein O9X98_07805 [Agrobacterium salinitolerans]|nr:hypothetical protein [Agrobacterium salinitolerans]
MQNIRLADLFACDDGGMMKVAEHREPRQPIHITAAERGLKCNCQCPVCGRALVARKGSRRHSFAHHPEDVQRSCAAAGETLLHRFSKEILAREGYILRPAMTAHDELGPLELKPAGKVAFDRVELEPRQGDVVPDVVCYLGTRRLFVEFKVTHAVDDAKLSKLREHEASVIEIDLSGYRDCQLADLSLVILEQAPRVMLQSEILDRAPRQLALRQEKRLEGFRTKAEPLIRAFDAETPLQQVSDDPWHVEAIRHSVADLLVERTVAKEPFRIGPWRMWVLWQLLTSKSGWTAKHLAYQMLKAGWVKPGLYDPAQTLCEFIRSHGQPDFRSATEAVQEYLSELKTRELAYKARGDRFFANGQLMLWLEERRAELRIPNERLGDLQKLVGSITRVLPLADRRDFDFDEWLLASAMKWKISADDLLSPNSGYFDELWDGLNHIMRAMAAFDIDADLDFLGLPLGNYFLDKQRKREDGIKRAKQQALRDSIRRADRIDAYARSSGNPRAAQWLLRPIEYEGRTAIPGEHASLSPKAVAEMHRLFDEERKRWEDEARFLRIKAESQAALLSHVTLAYGSRERANLWINCHLKEIGMRRPIDYCVDEATLSACLAALPTCKRR